MVVRPEERLADAWGSITGIVIHVILLFLAEALPSAELNII
jgi:hypothetical protein